jgi:hypothetical protein
MPLHGARLTRSLMLLIWLPAFCIIGGCATPQALPISLPSGAVRTVLPKASATTPVGATVSPPPTIAVTNESQLLPSGIRILEHPLITRPGIEPLVFTSIDGRREVEVFRTHASQLHQSLRPDSYYSVCGCSLWVMQGADKLEAAYEHSGSDVTAAVKRNGKLIFSVPNESPGVTSPFRVLAVYDDHWVLELAQRVENLDSSVYFSGRVFVDGDSLNEKSGYDESFGFQTIAGRPFYFYKRTGYIGIVADGQDVPLGYDEVPHYGCCSAGALNPRIAPTMIAFFARRGNGWYYVEIGAFDEDR